jgi:hypothetical protein
MRLVALVLRHWVLLVVLPCLAALPGCGSKEMYQVRGKVTYKDGSVPKGILAIVTLTPTGDSSATVRKGASGPIEPDGSFVMVTRVPGDGVHRGEYGVSFRVLRDATSTTSLISPKYSSMAPPPFTVNVDHDISDLSYQIERAEGVSEATSPPPTGPGSGPGT